MTDRPGAMAAPNRCRLTGRIVDVHDDVDAPGRRSLRLEISESESIQGGNFARVGEVVDAFTFEGSPQMAAGATLRSEAEYLGGPRAGRFQLYAPQIIEPA